MPEVVARLGGDGRAAEHKVFAAWSGAVGVGLTARSRPETLRGRTLFVRVESSALAHELTLLKATVLLRLGQTLGPGVVDDLRTRVGPLSESGLP
jgi:predicted nucleic acid-binding Zn ribbon protein